MSSARRQQFLVLQTRVSCCGSPPTAEISLISRVTRRPGQLSSRRPLPSPPVAAVGRGRETPRRSGSVAAARFYRDGAVPGQSALKQVIPAIITWPGIPRGRREAAVGVPPRRAALPISTITQRWSMLTPAPPGRAPPVPGAGGPGGGGIRWRPSARGPLPYGSWLSPAPAPRPPAPLRFVFRQV